MDRLPTPAECGFETSLQKTRRTLAAKLRGANGKNVLVCSFELHPHAEEMLQELEQHWKVRPMGTDPGEGTTYEISPKNS